MSVKNAALSMTKGHGRKSVNGGVKSIIVAILKSLHMANRQIKLMGIIHEH